MSTSLAKSLPRDARLIALLLASAGADDAEPAVVAMLLEFAHRWTSEVLQDAIVYREHATSKATSTVVPTLEDVRLAIRAKVEQSNSPAPSKEYLLPLAAALNRQPLPTIDGLTPTIRLPPEVDRLTAVNFDYVPRMRPPPDQPYLNGDAATTDSPSGGEEEEEEEGDAEMVEADDDEEVFEQVGEADDVDEDDSDEE